MFCVEDFCIDIIKIEYIVIIIRIMKGFLMGKILIIEDNKEIALQIKKYLVKNGYEVELASSFYEACYKMNVDMDLALLDINLPDKDGQHLIERLKDKDIRVIVTTVKNDEEFIISALDQGADDYITKPFSLAILRA